MDTNRENLIHFRATNGERRVLEIMADQEGRNLSEMLRELVREGAKSRGLYAVGLIDSLAETRMNRIAA